MTGHQLRIDGAIDDTGRHDDQDSAYWPTPAWCTRLLLQEHPPFPGSLVWEPSAGDGAIVRELYWAGYEVTAVEQRAECRDKLVRANARWVVTADWLSQAVAVGSSIVGNPPYNPASEMLAHVRHAVMQDADYIAMLLPLNWLASRSRYALNSEHPPTHCYPLAERPVFADGGGMRDIAWFVWDRTNRKYDPALRVLSKEMLRDA